MLRPVGKYERIGDRRFWVGGHREQKRLETEDHQENAMGREKRKLYKGARRQNYYMLKANMQIY